MTWVKLDDGFTDHPKVMGLCDRAFRVHVRALCYCARFSPGGAIPVIALRQLGATPAMVTELLAARVWEECDGLFHIHDFEDYQPKIDRDQKSEAGRIGGLRSAEARRKQSASNKTKQSASENLKQNSSSRADPVPSRPVPLLASEEAADAALPPAVREIRDTIMAKLPSKFQRDEAVWDEALSFAQDYAGLHEALAIAIAAVRRQPNTLPFPGNLRLHMPPLDAKPRASPPTPTLLNPMADGWPDARPEPDGTLPPKHRAEVKS